MKSERITIEIHPGEPECVKWVAEHVMSEFKRISLQSRLNLPPYIIIGSKDPRIKECLNRHPDVPRFEGFIIDKRKDNKLLVAAHHFRGTIFGLLELSRLLGVDPLEFFTDVPPRFKKNALSFPHLSNIPAYRYRGFFINQEDLLSVWKNIGGPIPLEVFDQIFLAILRLGGNMVLPGTYISPDSTILDLAAKRGLMLAQHHFQVVGTDTKRLTPSQRKKYSFVRFPEETREVWRYAIRQNMHRPTVWTLGYRGSDDAAFWFEEPGNFSGPEKGQIISKAIREQLKLLHEELDEKDIPCVYYLYRENQLLYQKGYIKVPEEVSIVWCDNGYGTMESYFRDWYEIWGMGQGQPVPAEGSFIPAWPKQQKPGRSMYYHVSFYDDCAPNRVQYVSPQKIQENFTQAHNKGFDYFLLLNVGNIREFVLGIAAVFDFNRSPEKWISDPKYHRIFLGKWCEYYFGEESAQKAADIYELLYEAHWWFSTSPGKCFGDNAARYLMHNTVLRLLCPEMKSLSGEYYMPGMQAKERTELILREGGESLDRWQKAVIEAEKLEKDLPESYRIFFHENAVVQCRRGFNTIKVLVKAIKAVKTLENQDDAKCIKFLDEAKQSMLEWEKALSAADREPKWKHWSRGDQIVLPQVVRSYLLGLESLIKADMFVRNSALDEQIKRGTGK